MRVKSKKEKKYTNPDWSHFPEYRIDFIYSENTYSGYLEGMPSMENRHNEMVTNRMINQAKSLYPHLEPFVYTGNLDTTKVYPYRSNIAWLNDMDRHMIVIWFDDGKMDIIQTLESIIDDVNFDKNSEQFDF